MGVIDPYGELNPGEIYCAYWFDNYSEKSSVKNNGTDVIIGEKHPTVIVSKMPCVHPGDV